jgi:hypothetical protein
MASSSKTDVTNNGFNVTKILLRLLVQINSDLSPFVAMLKTADREPFLVNLNCWQAILP